MFLFISDGHSSMHKIGDETGNWLQEPLPALGKTEQDPSTRQGDPLKHQPY